MRGETVRIEAERKLSSEVELRVFSVSKRSKRILYELRFRFFKQSNTVYVEVNGRDEVFALPVVDFLTYAPKRWIKEVLRAFTSQPEPEEVSVAEEER
jgi:hypothetical protein